MHAPSAERNMGVIVELLRVHAPPHGRALELASGTGQHVMALASALPQIDWHPSEVAADRMASIDAYAATAQLPNLHPARHLDATRRGWSQCLQPFDLIHLGNLLHLIPQAGAYTLLTEASVALAPAGTLTLYGPFMREGRLTSEGDAKFNAELQAANPAIGYKDDRWINEVLTSTGLVVSVHDMPSNNLAFIARRSPE
ncbi:DUF938 domain-containing protein [Sulfitobacter guttiformis]